MTKFNTIFPGFLTAADNLRLLLLPIAFVLIVIGLVLSVADAGRSIRRILVPIVRVAALSMLLVQLPVWGLELSGAVNDAIVNTLNADPAAVHQKFQSALLAQQGQETGGGWWGNLFDAASYFESMISALLLLLGMLAGVIVFYAYITQTFILHVGYALSPIFIGFLGVRGLSSIGSNFLLGLVGVICWPLGWGCASLLTDGLITFMVDRSLLSFGIGGAIGYGFQGLIGVAAIGLWLIVSTITSPVIIQKAMASGAQVGGALLSGALSAGVASLASGTTTGAAVAARLGESAEPGKESSAGQKAGAATYGAAFGGLAAMAAAAGSSLSGSTYSPSAAAISSLGGMLRPKSQKQQDYQANDPANDREVAELLNRSRS